MKKRIGIILAAGLVVAALATAVFCLINLAIDVKTGEYSFRRSFSRIVPGMPESRVLEILGEPDERSERFHLAQYEAFEEKYRQAELSGSKEYLFWKRGIDSVYVVGIDGDGEVSLTDVGGT